MTIDPDTVKLAGKSSLLANVDKISVPASDVDITGCTSSYQTTLDLKKYLPDGISLADSSFDGMVDLTVGIESAETTQFTVSISDISLENVPAGYKAEVTSVNDGRKVTSSSRIRPPLTSV